MIGNNMEMELVVLQVRKKNIILLYGNTHE